MFQSANDRVFNSKRGYSYGPPGRGLFQSANDRVFNSKDISHGRTVKGVKVSIR